MGLRRRVVLKTAGLLGSIFITIIYLMLYKQPQRSRIHVMDTADLDEYARKDRAYSPAFIASITISPIVSAPRRAT